MLLNGAPPRALEIDADLFQPGSGFLSACIGALARDVLSLEIDPELATAARARAGCTGLNKPLPSRLAKAAVARTKVAACADSFGRRAATASPAKQR